MIKNLYQILLIAVAISISGCTSDDDNPPSSNPDPSSNEFTVDSNNYGLSSGFRSRTDEDAPNLFLTNVILAGDGLNLNSSSNELVGTGDVVGFEFYSNSSSGLASGTYNMDATNNIPNTVYVFFATDYNANTGSGAIEDEVFQGIIEVTSTGNNTYRITGSGTADDLQQSFSIDYEGELRLID